MSKELYKYQAGPEPVAAAGLMQAFGTRLLCRAILENDWYSGALQLVVYNATDVMAFEVVSVGAGVAHACAAMGEQPPRVGQHLDARSVAGDRVHANNPAGRYWFIPIEDVAGVWDPVDLKEPGFARAVEEVRARNAGNIAVSDARGEVDLSPGR